MQPLASIQRISEIKPHLNADTLELAKVLGWQVVVKKGDFNPDDLCVYIEIDSVVPDRPEFSFLKDRGFRIKTVKLRGEISQGIAFSLGILPVEPPFSEENEDFCPFVVEGRDVTEILQIKKWELPLPTNMGGKVKGHFPSFIPKTDEVRIQSVPEVLSEFQGKKVYITDKIDGTSATYYFNDGSFGVCSRNLEYKMEDTNNFYVQIASQYNLSNILERYGRVGLNLAFQGEIAGKGIQKNHLGLPDRQFFLFNIFAIDGHSYFDFEAFSNFSQLVGIPTVPIIGTFDFNYTLEELLELAKGNYQGTSLPREGIVIRPVVETYSEVLKGRLSVKVVNNDYLLKYGE